jgi:hypothetical protein
MKKLAVFAVFGFILGIVGLAWGHVGLTWYSAEVTSATPIAIDGDLSDWAWIDEGVYVLTGDDLMETLGGDMPAKDDWDCALYPGWSRSENMLYFGIRVMDDVFYNGAPDVRHMNDCVEVLVDADNSGGPWLKPVWGEQAQQYTFFIPPSDDVEAFSAYDVSHEWAMQPPWVVCAYDDSDLPNATYEWKMAIWDRIDPEGGAGASTPHILAPDQTIGFTIQIDAPACSPIWFWSAEKSRWNPAVGALSSPYSGRDPDAGVRKGAEKSLCPLLYPTQRGFVRTKDFQSL